MIPVNGISFSGNEAKYLNECIETGWVSSEGPLVRRFEETFASFSDRKYGVAVCNGTAALESALAAIGVGEGDEVIMPSFTIISCAISCLRLGAKPVLVDIEPDACTMDVSRIESRITSKTKAIMPVHIYGNPVDMDEVFRVAGDHGLKIVEDFAEAQGALYFSKRSGGRWLKCGSMGDVSATSFYANKLITTGEGGMVVTSDERIAERARIYRNVGFGKEERFRHEDIGYNFRMTNLQAALGVAGTEQAESRIGAKRKMAEHYGRLLSGIGQLRLLPEKRYAKSSHWVYAIMLDPGAGIAAADLSRMLKERGVETRPFFRGMHDQPVLNKMGLFRGEKYPLTDLAYKYGLYLPSGSALTEGQAYEVVEALKAVLKR